MLTSDIPSNFTLSALPDLEIRIKANSCNYLRTWLRSLSCDRLIENEVRSRLRREFKHHATAL